MKLKLINNKYVILIHILFWSGYLSLSVFVFSGGSVLEHAPVFSLVQIIPQMFIAYLNMEYLIPKFFMRKKYFLYIISVVGCFVGLHLFYEFIFPFIIDIYFPPGIEGRRWMNENRPGRGQGFRNPARRFRIVAFTQTLAIYFLSTAFKTSQIALKREKEASELKSENLNSELKFLRSQINPHFLFNALNNIYSLSIVKSDKTPDIILKLSDMLRYIIYDCNAERVPLEKEINYINNYIDLQRLKDDDITNIKMDVQGVDPSTSIAPMIFIPFIENSFKHSKIEDLENGWIKIKIVNKTEQLTFEISNSLSKSEFTKDKIGGVGIENVKRRLELLYPKKHELNISQADSTFLVKLKLIS